ncbi:MAG: signal peptide peptidase SppA [Deltaproteobacteria bacterium]|nr:signal peptide peptidase SppA [Deltaproteobacteria bacterium]
MKSLFKAIRYFLSGFWRGLSICRVIVTNLLFLALIIFLISIILYDAEKDLPDQAALVLSLQGNIVEQKTETMLSNRLFGDTALEEILLKDVIDVIEHAAEDQRVQALVLDLRNLGRAGISKLQDIGAALQRFKTSGKTIYAYGDYFDQHRYYLAAHADQMNMHPMGGILLTGFGIYRNYFKSALEKLLIQLHVFRVGTYKSALEPFLRDDMSEYAKEANLSWLNVLWDIYKANVAQLRGFSPEAIDDYINNMSAHLASTGGDSAQLALDYGLVDALKTRDAVQEDLIRLVGENEEEKTYNQIKFNEYLNAIKPELMQTDPDSSKVGIIVARGIILDGTQPTGRIGGDTLAELVRKARLDDDIKALVLRIDSPGGSALASDIIRREMEITRQSGKPVIVSMGSVAASGGYWIASAADQIWAAPTTITGSIGIYSAFPTFEKSLGSLGIHNDGVGTTRLADAFDTARPINPILADSMEQTIQHSYHSFIHKVSEGRNMAPQDVEKIAQGRVWAGETALELGLVDAIGNLQDAVQSAAEMIDLEDYDVIYVEQSLTAREKMIRRLNRFLTGVFNSIWGHTVPPAVRVYRSIGFELERVMELNDPKGVYAYCLICDVD